MQPQANLTVTTNSAKPQEAAGKGKFMQITKKQALGWSIAITLVVMVVEFVAGYLTHSLMLFSDGLHMLTHALSLGISLAAIHIAARKVSEKYPYGLASVEVIAALINGVGLIFFTIYIFYESALRLMNPIAINVWDTGLVACVGLAVNLLTAFILSRAGIEDLNTRSAYLHLLSDTFSSVAIIIGCVIIRYTGWMAIDPLLSIIVGLVILKWAFGLIKESIDVILNKVPDSVDPAALRSQLLQQFEAVNEISHFRVWQPASGQVHATATLVFQGVPHREALAQSDAIKAWLCKAAGACEVTLEVQVMPLSAMTVQHQQFAITY